jgi:membrane protease YdiL (CAAX protease family)
MVDRDCSSRAGQTFSGARYLIDIIILAAGVFGLEAVFSAIPVPADLRIQIAGSLISKAPIFLFAWLLLRWRGETLATVGLKAPRNWWLVFLLSVVVAGILFIAVWLLERAGYRRDLSQFNFVKGNIELTWYQIVYVLIGAGLYEEFIFRGFLFHRLAMMFGGRRAAWVTACLFQAGLFGYAHAYQNPIGIVITGTIGLIFSLLFLAAGRNLWLPIIAHGLYDASRVVLFYFQGAPSA